MAKQFVLDLVITKLKQSDVKWALTSEQKNELRMIWAKNTIRSVEDIIGRYYLKHKNEV